MTDPQPDGNGHLSGTGEEEEEGGTWGPGDGGSEPVREVQPTAEPPHTIRHEKQMTHFSLPLKWMSNSPPLPPHALQHTSQSLCVYCIAQVHA